ncbi:PIG-L family deacetylase [Dactylosporangium matsuzakiense]|nr:PIG-L family deacetylase [Dactylosporangium matsuzakiense]
MQRALCVLAHPDDVDFGSAGTIATWVDAGIEVKYLLVTRGDAGGFDDTPRAEMPILREREQRAAAAAVGVKQVEFLEGYRDGVLEPTIGLRRDITAAIRRFRPDRVLTSSPLRRWERLAGPSHPDHLAAGEATTCAVYPDARNPFTFTDIGLDAWTVREIWYSGGPNPDHIVDITDVFDRKLAALRAHASQTSHLDGFEEMLRDRHAQVARAGGLAEGRLAEGYSVFSTA